MRLFLTSNNIPRLDQPLQILKVVPPLANDFFLSRFYNKHWEDRQLQIIRNDLCNTWHAFQLEDQVGPIKMIGIKYKDDYTRYLVKRLIGSEIPTHIHKILLSSNLLENKNGHASNKMQIITQTYGSGRIIHTPSNAKQLIMSHLSTNSLQAAGVHRQQLPPLPFSNPNISYSNSKNPFRPDGNQTQLFSEQTPPTTQQSKSSVSPEIHIIPTFKSNTLMVGTVHQVYCSYIAEGPNLFSIQLKSSEEDLDRMMAEINDIPVKNLSEKPSMGMACLARYKEDNNIYRAVIMMIKATTCTVAFVDYGNSDDVAFSDIFEIPSKFLKHTIFAMRFTLSGYRELGSCNETINKYFESQTITQLLDLKVKPLDGPPFVQYCELYVNGENILEKLKNMAIECQKYAAPELRENELVQIRYVHSAKKFFVQESSNLNAFNKMMDQLMVYCQKAPQLRNAQVGLPCATKFGQDEDWYRVEIMQMYKDRESALIQYVDFGISNEAKLSTLKTITGEFLAMAKQAIEVCLEGFNDIPLSDSMRNQLEFLAEDAAGERRNFKVKIIKQGTVPIVNLIDDSTVPTLDLSTRMFKLAMPNKTFRYFEQQKFKPKSTAVSEEPDKISEEPTSIGQNNMSDIVNSTAIHEDQIDGVAEPWQSNGACAIESNKRSSGSWDESAENNRGITKKRSSNKDARMDSRDRSDAFTLEVQDTRREETRNTRLEEPRNNRFEETRNNRWDQIDGVAEPWQSNGACAIESNKRSSGSWDESAENNRGITKKRSSNKDARMDSRERSDEFSLEVQSPRQEESRNTRFEEPRNNRFEETRNNRWDDNANQYSRRDDRNKRHSTRSKTSPEGAYNVLGNNNWHHESIENDRVGTKKLPFDEAARFDSADRADRFSSDIRNKRRDDRPKRFEMRSKTSPEGAVNARGSNSWNQSSIGERQEYSYKNDRMQPRSDGNWSDAGSESNNKFRSGKNWDQPIIRQVHRGKHWDESRENQRGSRPQNIGNWDDNEPEQEHRLSIESNSSGVVLIDDSPEPNDRANPLGRNYTEKKRNEPKANNFSKR